MGIWASNRSRREYLVIVLYVKITEVVLRCENEQMMLSINPSHKSRQPDLDFGLCSSWERDFEAML